MLYEKLKPSIEKVLKFHVKNAPGVIMGVYMVDYAYELLDGIYPDRKSYTLNALCETRVCLIDPIQVMTGCTVGNKQIRLDAIDYGRYAMALYNRDTSAGFRVYVDMKKIAADKYPQLSAFFNKTRDYRSKNREELSRLVIEEFYSVERGIFSFQKIKVNIPAKDGLKPAAICKNCGESFMIDAALTGETECLCDYCGKLLKAQSVPYEILR